MKEILLAAMLAFAPAPLAEKDRYMVPLMKVVDEDSMGQVGWQSVKRIPGTEALYCVKQGEPLRVTCVIKTYGESGVIIVWVPDIEATQLGT